MSHDWGWYPFTIMWQRTKCTQLYTFHFHAHSLMETQCALGVRDVLSVRGKTKPLQNNLTPKATSSTLDIAESRHLVGPLLRVVTCVYAFNTLVKQQNRTLPILNTCKSQEVRPLFLLEILSSLRWFSTTRFNSRQKGLFWKPQVIYSWPPFHRNCVCAQWESSFTTSPEAVSISILCLFPRMIFIVCCMSVCCICKDIRFAFYISFSWHWQCPVWIQMNHIRLLSFSHYQSLCKCLKV